MRKRSTFRLGTVLLIIAAPFVMADAIPDSGDFYVAPAGDDTGPGTREKPFATLERARDALRADGKAGGTVLLREGVYVLKQTFSLGVADSGTKKHPAIFAAHPNERPILDGGLRLKGEWKGPGPDGVWTMKPEGTDLRIEELFVDGTRQTRARMPNEGYWKARAVGTSKKTFGYEEGRLSNWPDITSGTVVVKPYEWVDFHLPIESIDEAKREVTLAEPAGYPIVSGGYGSNGEYFVENLRAAIDVPGEWCFNSKTGELSFLPPKGVDPAKAEVIAGGLPVMVSVTGDVKKDRWAEHIQFLGLTFRHSGRHVKWRFYQGTALRLNSGARHCTVDNCAFYDLGGSGVVIWKECRENRVSRCDLTRTGDTPIRIFDYLGEGPPMSWGNQIVTNSIHGCGTVRKNIAGIGMAMTGGNLVAGNWIYEMPYNGISLSGTRPQYWQKKHEPSLQPPYTAAKIKPFIPAKKNVVEGNHIYRVMQEFHDGGAIYFWGTMGKGANEIRDNVIRDVGKGKRTCVGLYLDDNCDDVIVKNNLVVRANIGLHLHGAPRNVIENNFFVFSGSSDISVQPEKYNVAPMGTVLRRNIFYGALKDVFKDTHWAAWDKQPLKEMDYNLYWVPGREVKPGQGNFKGFDEHSLTADPLFVDAEKGDFRFKKDSPALKLGIQPIKKVITKDRLRAFE